MKNTQAALTLLISLSLVAFVLPDIAMACTGGTNLQSCDGWWNCVWKNTLLTLIGSFGKLTVMLGFVGLSGSALYNKNHKTFTWRMLLFIWLLSTLTIFSLASWFTALCA